jgi:hypothetical protein
MENDMDSSSTNDINRKEAIKKISKYAALTAMGTFLILNPQKAQATSAPSAPGGW